MDILSQGKCTEITFTVYLVKNEPTQVSLILITWERECRVVEVRTTLFFSCPKNGKDSIPLNRTLVYDKRGIQFH